MNSAKLFQNGRSQAVRLPKECRFEGSEVFIKKCNNMVILLPKDSPWGSFIESLDQFSEDYLDDRNQPTQQIREDPE